jgi:hypothetical protein
MEVASNRASGYHHREKERLCHFYRIVGLVPVLAATVKGMGLSLVADQEAGMSPECALGLCVRACLILPASELLPEDGKP